MTTAEVPLIQQYAAALESLMAGRQEPGFQMGYEASCQALAKGAGFFDLAGAYQSAIREAMGRGYSPQEAVGIAQMGLRFLNEAMAPLEMIGRGYRDVMWQLRHANEALEAQVQERTDRLDQRTKELTALNQLFRRHLAQQSAVVEKHRDFTSSLQDRLQEMAASLAAAPASPPLLRELGSELRALAEQARSLLASESPQNPL